MTLLGVYMRVIAGKARRTILQAPEGLDTRPTTDRIKETLFNMINGDLYDAEFLDLFSGSGAIGIEALSRGAKKAVFVENSAPAIKCIENNLIKTKLIDASKLYKTDVLLALERLKGQCFDIIFMDPPYKLGIEEKVLELISKYELTHTGTTIIIEADLNNNFDFISKSDFEIIKEKKYKTNKHIFLQKKQ